MVRPRYIICSEGQTLDRATGLIAYWNVIDAITITLPDPAPPTPIIVGTSMHVSAVWMREDDSEKHTEFEAEVRLFPPASDEGHVIFQGKIRFGEHYFHRINVAIRPGVGAGAIRIKPCDGVMRLECRIRPAQGGDWLWQDYLIPVKVNRIGSPADAEADSSSA